MIKNRGGSLLILFLWEISWKIRFIYDFFKLKCE